MNELIDKILKETEEFKFNDEQKEYYIFMFLKTIKDANKRAEAIKYLKEQGFVSFKSLFLSILCQGNNDYKNYIDNISEFKLLDENYKNILIKTKELAKELNLNNSLEVSNLYTYLLWNGYYSKDLKLQFQPFKRNMINTHYSFDIMSGKGVCLNFSDMLTDIINLYDYNAASVINVFDIKQKKYYIPKIERNIAKANIGQKLLNIVTTPLANKIGNHAFTLITDKDKMYIYDPTNFMIFNIDNKYKCSNIWGTGECKLKPVFSHYINHSEKSDFALGTLNLNNKYNSAYNSKDFLISFENCIENFSNNKNLLNNFHEEIINNINIINDNSKEVKKLIKEYRKQITTNK